MDEQPVIPLDVAPVAPLSDPISIALLAIVEPHLGSATFVEHHPLSLLRIYQRYVDELRYICATHTLSNSHGVRLIEAEIVVGTILAKCSQTRWRKERMYRMRLHAQTLVSEVQKGFSEKSSIDPNVELIQALEISWSAWDLSLRRRNEFGAQSFGLIALGTLFDCLDKLESRSHSISQ